MARLWNSKAPPTRRSNRSRCQSRCERISDGGSGRHQIPLACRQHALSVPHSSHAIVLSSRIDSLGAHLFYLLQIQFKLIDEQTTRDRRRIISSIQLISLVLSASRHIRGLIDGFCWTMITFTEHYNGICDWANHLTKPLRHPCVANVLKSPLQLLESK